MERGHGATAATTPLLLSETNAGRAGVRGEGRRDHAVALGQPDHVPDLAVQLHQLGADLRQVLAGAHQGEGAGLAQRLVSEVDVEERLHLVLRVAAEDLVWPRAPGKGKRLFFFALVISFSLLIL